MGSGDGLEEAGVTPVAPGEHESFEAPRNKLMENGSAVAAGLVGATK